MALPPQHGSIRFQATPERSRPLTENAESPGEEINTEALHCEGDDPQHWDHISRSPQRL